MQKNREGYLVSDTHRECTSCGIIFARTNMTVALCHECNSNRVKSRCEVKKMWARARSRATEMSIPFDIVPEDLIVPEVCPVLGIPIYHTKGKSGAFKNSPSLDRKNPAKGYVKGNVCIMSQRANQMKGAATREELIKFADWVNETMRD